MTTFRKYNQDVMLAVTALGMIVGVIWFVWWGTTDMIAAVNKALDTAPLNSDNTEIDLEGAKKILTTRGLIQ